MLTSFLSRPATARMSCSEAPERAERSCASSAALCWRRPLSSARRASARVVAAASSLLSCATCSLSPAPCKKECEWTLHLQLSQSLTQRAESESVCMQLSLHDDSPT